MNTLALCRFSFKRPANIKTYVHTLDRTVSEISKNNISVFWILTFVLAPQSQNDIFLPFSVRARSEKSPFLDFSSPGEFNGSDGSVAV